MVKFLRFLSGNVWAILMSDVGWLCGKWPSLQAIHDN
jgi:hypothetical protein